MYKELAYDNMKIKFIQVALLLTCLWGVPSLNLGWNTHHFE